MKPIVRILIVGMAAFGAVRTVVAENPPTLQWIRQPGIQQWYDSFTDVAVDGLGNVFVGSHQFDQIGLSIDLLRRYDVSGTVSWTREVGTSANFDLIWELWPDKQGNVYITGHTAGNIGAPNAGFPDAYLRKYDVQGNVLWSRQLGSTATDEFRRITGTAAGDIYVAGFTEGELARPIAGISDAVLAKYDAEGNQHWIKQFGGVSSDSIRGLTTDPSGNIIVAGIAGHDPPAGLGGFFSKYDGNGDLIFTKDYGDRKVDQVHDISTDEAGNIYLLEQIGDVPSNTEYFVSKYDSHGDDLWTRTLGARGGFLLNEIEADAAGNLYVTGATKLSLGRTNPSPDQFDAFVRKYDANGNVRWTYQFGTDGGDFGGAVALDGRGNIFLVGETDGSLAVANPTSSRDAWIALLREQPIPEPGTALLSLLAVAIVATYRR